MSKFKPLSVCFEGQRKNEDVFIFLRRHPVSFLPFFFLVLALFFLPFAIALLISGDVSKDIAIIVLTFYYLGLLSVFMVGWLDFYYDIHIVTSTRIVDIDQNGLFHRVNSELEMEQVEDVTFKLKGILGNVFKYGTIEIQTAGTARNFFFEDVPNPAVVAAKIMEIAEYYKSSQN